MLPHDVLFWPLHEDEVGHDQLMNDMWAILQACRSTTASLAEYRERWIASRLLFRDWAFKGGHHLWTMIGVDTTLCDLIVTLQLRFMGFNILAPEDNAIDDQIMQTSLSCDGFRQTTFGTSPSYPSH